MEGLSRLVRIPALHAGGHGFESHPLHSIHGFIAYVFILRRQTPLIVTRKMGSKVIEIEEREKLTRKIKSLTIYLKPYISKTLNELVQTNPINVKIICDYITAEQNELNIKDSTKETKIKTCTFIQIL